MHVFKRYFTPRSRIGILCIVVSVLLSACQTTPGITQVKIPTATPSSQVQVPSFQPALQPTQRPHPTATIHEKPSVTSPSPTATHGSAASGSSPSTNPVPTSPTNTGRPLLAFYYTWYTPSTWCSCHMSDLPTTQYTSRDVTTFDRQLNEAASAGITGFISSWWGPGDVTDTNFTTLLARSAVLQNTTGYHFASSIYFESDSPGLQGSAAIVNALRYLVSHYGSSPYFFHWNGKPVLFFWDPLGGGRTLAEWASIRSQVDPNDQTIWSAEGVDMSLLTVFDGIHLFSAGYWGLQHGDMPQVDQGFRSQVSAYNAAHGTQKIWAAGVMPGYNDTLVPGRTGTFVVPRNNGATYQASWTGALSSQPDWITITSFNEWFEGSMIEPSVSYGNLYLNMTLPYARQWHG